MSQTKQREYSLDFLKIVGTVLIMLHHFQGAFGVQYGPVNFASGNFYFGNVVELFFMISGYFASKYIERIKCGLSFRDYYLNRIIRLVPLMFISTFVYSVCYAIIWRGEGVWLWKMTVTAFGMSSGGLFNEMYVNSHFWYLSVLLICYAVFFLSTRLAANKGFNCVYSYIAVIILGTSAISYGLNLPFLNGNVGRGYMSFFIGVLVALSLKGKIVSNKLAAFCASVVAAGFLLIIFKWDWVSYGCNYFLCFFFYPALIVLFKAPFMDRLFSHKILGTLAGISFNAYIWHMEFNVLSYSIFGVLNINVDYSTVVTELIYILIEFGIGAVSYYLIEKPVTKKITQLLFPEKNTQETGETANA